MEPSIGRYVELIRAEFRESPGLCLTKAQIERLWCLDAATSAAVLAALVEARALRRARGGYVRADAGDEVPSVVAAIRRPRPLTRD